MLTAATVAENTVRGKERDFGDERSYRSFLPMSTSASYFRVLRTLFF
jgi:hypothetical protein